MPYFTLLDFRSVQPQRVLRRADLNSLFEFVFHDMHQEGRFSFYYATRERVYQRRHLADERSLAPVRGLPVFDRYDILLEGAVLPGIEPAFANHRSLVNPSIGKVPYWIKRGSLKMRFVVDYLATQSHFEPK
jgi:hypothetical protein